MALVKVKRISSYSDTTNTKCRINQLRRSILVHSCIYYRFDTNIIDDHQYDMMCKELAELQAKYPELADECVYAEAFKGFDGSTGFDLPIGNPDIINKATYLIDLCRRLNNGN